MSYREGAREVHKEARWTFWKFLPLIIAILVVLGGLGVAMRSAGLLGSTIVERKVFENSYQRSESLKAQIANDEAVLTEIERNLARPDLDSETRGALEAQAAAARVRLSTAKGKM